MINFAFFAWREIRKVRRALPSVFLSRARLTRDNSVPGYALLPWQGFCLDEWAAYHGDDTRTHYYVLEDEITWRLWYTDVHNRISKKRVSLDDDVQSLHWSLWLPEYWFLLYFAILIECCSASRFKMHLRVEQVVESVTRATVSEVNYAPWLMIA